MFTTSRAALFALLATVALAPMANAQTAPGTAVPQRRTEAAPIFRVQEILSDEIIQGPDYFIGVDVPVRENKYLFTIKTSFGEFNALGRNMLELRLREMHSIDLARNLVQDPQILNGITQTIKQTPQGLKIALGDPAGTLLRAPQGLKRMANNLLDAQNRRAGNEERRKLAVNLGCDPETTNPVLMALLDNISFRKSIGKTGTNLGMNIALPGLGLLSTTKNFKEELVRRAPSEINDDIEKSLLASGVWEPIAKEFCRERSFTTMQRMIFMDHFRTLRNVENAQFLVYRATTAVNEAEGLGLIREMQLMRQLHENYGIERIDLQGLPVAMLRDKRTVIVNASDYIYDSQQLRDAIASFRRVRPNDPATFVTAGRVSTAAKMTFAEYDVQVNDSGKTQLAKRISDTERRQ